MQVRRPDDMRERIRMLSGALRGLADRPVKVMEVCGTHTVSRFQAGIKGLFAPDVELVSGPGCPVCVTSQGEIDAAISLAGLSGTTVATYEERSRSRKRDNPGGRGSRGRT